MRLGFKLRTRMLGARLWPERMAPSGETVHPRGRPGVLSAFEIAADAARVVVGDARCRTGALVSVGGRRIRRWHRGLFRLEHRAIAVCGRGGGSRERGVRIDRAYQHEHADPFRVRAYRRKRSWIRRGQDPHRARGCTDHRARNRTRAHHGPHRECRDPRGEPARASSLPPRRWRTTTRRPGACA